MCKACRSGGGPPFFIYRRPPPSRTSTKGTPRTPPNSPLPSLAINLPPSGPTSIQLRALYKCSRRRVEVRRGQQCAGAQLDEVGSQSGLAAGQQRALHQVRVGADLVQRAFMRGARCVDSAGRVSLSRELTGVAGTEKASSVGERNSERTSEASSVDAAGALLPVFPEEGMAWILEYGNSTVRYPPRCLQTHIHGEDHCLDDP